jgi:hypothetical protein
LQRATVEAEPAELKAIAALEAQAKAGGAPLRREGEVGERAAAVHVSAGTPRRAASELARLGASIDRER